MNDSTLAATKWFGCAVIVMVQLTLAQLLEPVTIGVAPLKSVGIEDGAAAMIRSAVERKLGTDAQVTVVPGEAVAQSFADEELGFVTTPGQTDALEDGAEASGVDILVFGSVGNIGSIYSFFAGVWDQRSGNVLWSRDYEHKGTVEGFYSTVPAQVAGDVLESLRPAHDHAVERETLGEVAESGPEVEIVVDDASGIEVEDEPPPNLAIAKGPTFGICVRYAPDELLGARDGDQAPWGAVAMYVHPTGPNKQLRLKAGAPIGTSDSMALISDRGYPDTYAGLEHEWAWEHFGLIAGMNYWRMHSFDAVYTYLPDSYAPYSMRYRTVTATYQAVNALGLTLGIRGGRPHKGFHGRFSWPLPLVLRGGIPSNYVFEYSALGCFGTNSFKVGLGIQGMYKRREADTLIAVDTLTGATSRYPYESESSWDYYDDTNNYNDFDQRVRTVTEFYSMVPVVRGAIKLGNRSVLSINIELGGLVVPRPAEDAWWTPNFGFDYIFSLGAIDGPEPMDGLF